MRIKPGVTKINRENSNLAELNEDPTRTDQEKPIEFKASRIKQRSKQDQPRSTKEINDRKDYKGLLNFFECLTGCKKLIQPRHILESKSMCTIFLKKIRKRAKKVKKDVNGLNI